MYFGMIVEMWLGNGEWRKEKTQGMMVHGLSVFGKGILKVKGGQVGPAYREGERIALPYTP